VKEIKCCINSLRLRARRKRAQLFLRTFQLTGSTRILDLGSQDGTNIASIIKNTALQPENVFIADIDDEIVLQGYKKFGFTPIVISECGGLPFADFYFDIVLCSSVIEHVTIPKSAVWRTLSGRDFDQYAFERQKEFSSEIRRIGKGYFVQTPHKWFPIESHTQLPFVSYLPREVLVPFIRFTNKKWIKRTSPDWRLLTSAEIRKLFPDARIVKEQFFGLTKSIIAIKDDL